MKRLIKITESNKPYIARRYTDYIVSRMDHLEILEQFKDYFYREKVGYPIDTLQTEITKFCPEVLEDHIIESVVGKGPEYAHAVNNIL